MIVLFKYLKGWHMEQICSQLSLKVKLDPVDTKVQEIPVGHQEKISDCKKSL